MKKRIIGFMLCFVLLFSTVTAFASSRLMMLEDALSFECLATSTHDFLVEWYGLEYAINYQRSIEYVEQLYSMFPRNRAGDVIYPEFFGGIYLDSYGNLNMLVTYSDYPLIVPFSRDDGVITRNVQFSYNQLSEALDALGELAFGEYGCFILGAVSGFWLSVRNNQVIVDLLDYADKNNELFKNMALYFPFIVFRQSAGLYEMPEMPEEYSKVIVESPYQSIEGFSTTVVWAGDRIFLRNASNNLVLSGTVGYRAFLGGNPRRYGFITAGHLGINTLGRPLQINQRLYNSSGGYIGSVRAVRLANVDAAFIEMPSGSVFAGQPHSAAPNIEGNPVMMDRGASGNLRRGVITYRGSANLSLGLVNGFGTSLTSTGGDSGSKVFTTSSLVNGIHVAGRPGGTFFTSVDDHRSFLGSNPR